MHILIVNITWTSSSYMVLFMYGFICFVPFLEDKGIFRCILVDVNCKVLPSLELVGEVEHWAKKEMQGTKDEDSKDSEDAKYKNTKTPSCIRWSSWFILFTRSQESAFPWNGKEHFARATGGHNAGSFAFVHGTFPNASSSCKEVPRQEMMWHDMWIVKAENFGQEKLEQEATELDRPCFFHWLLCRIHSSHSYPVLTVLLYLSLIPLASNVTSPGFAIKNYWDATSSPWRTRSNGWCWKQTEGKSETKEREKDEKAKALRSWDQTVSGLPCCEGCWSYSPPCSLPIGGGVEGSFSNGQHKNAVKCKDRLRNYAWWYVWAPVPRLRFCDQSMGREGAKSKRKVEGDEHFRMVCNRLFFVSVLGIFGWFPVFRACFLLADGSDVRWTSGVMLMSSSSSNCRVCRTNSRN